ncbi:hypothetical protein BDN71DRAFT_1095044 [Pleurotus eryngii]|uniref:Uncharacterized protein n=1 Tax=Pleurotus eryngii TaxID=5323 RepID=A0A9P6DFA6_PLEER|nr:hypothetical protein BDN71DRAFT_1095044 [Pleurotus eryngii]
MSRRLSHPPATHTTTTLPPFSNLIQHERAEWHRNSASSSIGQSTPSSSPLELRHPHLGDDSGGSSVSSSDDYQYGAWPRQMQPPASLPDFRYRQHIPDTVIEPSLREPYTSRSRSQHNERRSTQCEPDKSTPAQAFGLTRVAPMEQYEPPQTYPPVGSRHYNKHDYIFCPGEAPATAPFLGVRIENKVDTPVTHEYDREHRYTDHYARYNEGTRIDWHCHEPRSSPQWPPNDTSPDSLRHLPIQPQAPVSASSASWPSPSPHEGRSVGWLHHRSTTSAPLSPTHTSPNTSGLGYVPVRHQPPPIETIDAAFTPPSEWTSSASSYGVQVQTGPLPQPPKGTNETCTYPNASSLGHSPSGRDGERDKNGNETYSGFASACTIVDNAQAGVSGSGIGRRSQKGIAAPSVAESGLEVGANTERPVANAPRASSSGTKTTTRPGITESTTEAGVTVEDVRTNRKEVGEVVKDPGGKSKQHAPRRSTKGVKRGSLLMEWAGPEPPVPLPPIKRWGRERRSTKAKTAASKAWRVDVNAVSEVEVDPEAERRGDSTLNIQDTPREPSDHAEIRKSSTKKRKGDNDVQPTSIGTTEEGSRAGGSQTHLPQKPPNRLRRPRKCQFVVDHR